MKGCLTVISSFVIMVCSGSIYAWSMVASELISNYHFTTLQTQIIFGTTIAVFPTIMVLAGKFTKSYNPRQIVFIAGLCFVSGYYIAGSLSGGNFLIIFFGIGILVGIGTGLCYLVSITVPTKWYPNRQGFITGITTAGFGLGAIAFSTIMEILKNSNRDILNMITIIGIMYGGFLLLLSNVLFVKQDTEKHLSLAIQTDLWSDILFRKLFTGLFLGTFGGLMVIGNLKLIGANTNISHDNLISGIAFFAVANFTGRLIWGILSDYIGARPCIIFALTIQALAICLLGLFELNHKVFLALVSLTGLGFGGNFVLFAKETACRYGINGMSTIYPYVFLGYAVAGIAGPLFGGFLVDYFGNYNFALYCSAIVSLSGGLIFLKNRAIEPVSFYTLFEWKKHGKN